MTERETKTQDRREDDAAPLSGNGLVDEMSEESFPASDPPSTNPQHAGDPRPVGKDRAPGTQHEPRD
jgi:hypothetical protein